MKYRDIHERKPYFFPFCFTKEYVLPRRPFTLSQEPWYLLWNCPHVLRDFVYALDFFSHSLVNDGQKVLNKDGNPLYVPKALCVTSSRPIFSVFTVFLRHAVSSFFDSLERFIVTPSSTMTSRRTPPSELVRRPSSPAFVRVRSLSVALIRRFHSWGHAFRWWLWFPQYPLSSLSSSTSWETHSLLLWCLSLPWASHALECISRSSPCHSLRWPSLIRSLTASFLPSSRFLMLISSLLTACLIASPPRTSSRSLATCC